MRIDSSFTMGMELLVETDVEAQKSRVDDDSNKIECFLTLKDSTMIRKPRS